MPVPVLTGPELAALLGALPTAAGICDADHRLLRGNAALGALSLRAAEWEVLSHGQEFTLGGTRRFQGKVTALSSGRRAVPRLFLIEVMVPEADGANSGGHAPIARLTVQERRVAALLARGQRNGTIAAALRISPHTARRHTENIMAKLHVTSRAEVPWRLAAIGENTHAK